MNKDQLVRIYQDTVRICDNIDDNSITTKHTFKEISMFPPNKKEGNIIVEPIDTITSAMKHSLTGKTCILNMASYKRPGGGVRNGSMSQEECLFRSTNLYKTLVKDFYPLSDRECLYTKDALIVKDGDYGTLISNITIDCVTMAAINLNKIHKDYEYFETTTNEDSLSDFELIRNYEDMTKMKIRLMLSLAHKNGCDNIILGAWGCGVYSNDPNEVSQFFHDVLNINSMRYMFKNVVFAIINDHNSMEDNYTIFKNRLT